MNNAFFSEIRMIAPGARSVRRSGQGLAGLACALALIASAVWATAQETPTADPAPPLGPARALNLPHITEFSLDNGLKIVLMEDHKQPALWLRLAVPAGTLRDPAGKIGLVEMTAELLDKGTTTRSETQIADTIDGLGATLGASADDDYLTVSASGLSVYAGKLFDLMSDISLRPTFPATELDKARVRTLNGLTSELANPKVVAGAVIARMVYGAHPYGNFSAGTPTTLKAITRADVAQFQETYFAPNVSTLFIVGDITPQEAKAKAQASFGGWKQKTVPPAPPAPAATASGTQPKILIIDRPGAAQTEIRIGALVGGRKDPTRIPALLGATILGEGFDGRLNTEIRVKRGLTYGAYSSFDRNKMAGAFTIDTFTKNASTGEVVKLALGEAKKMAETPPTDAELQARKNYLNGTFAVAVATPNGVLGYLETAVLTGDGPEELRTRALRVQETTPTEVQAAMKALPLDSMAIALVGDASAIEKQVADIGPVTKIAYDSLDLASPTLQAAPKPADTAAPATASEQAEGKARLHAAIKALGGDSFQNLKSLVVTGKGEIVPPGQAAGFKLPLESVKLSFVTPDKARLDMKTGFGEIVFASPGSTMGAWISFAGMIQEAPSGFTANPDPTALLRRAAQSNFPVRSLPDIKGEDGVALRGFAVTEDTGRTIKVYTDASDLVRHVEVGSAESAATFLVSNYRATEGLQLPGSLKLQRGGKDFLTLTFDNYTVNKDVDPTIFAHPK